MSKRKTTKQRRSRKRASVDDKKAFASGGRLAAVKETSAADSVPTQARQLLRRRQFAEAKSLLERAIAESGASARSYSALSLAHLGCDELAAAQASVAAAIELGLPSAAEQLGFGAAAFREGDWQRAEAGFQLAAQIEPSSFDVQLNLAMAAHRGEHLETAIEAYDRALEIEPSHFNGLYNRGVALKRTGQLELATRSLEQAFAQQPENTDVLCNLGQVAHQDNRLSEARHWFTLALQVDGANAAVLHWLGNISLTQEQYEDAAAHYFRSLEHQPNNPDALNNLGGALLKLGADKEAERCFRQALELDKQHVRAWENLGDLLVREGAVDAALECFTKALAADPELLSALVKKGRALRRLKRPQDAAREFQAALSINAHSGGALSELGMIAFHEGDNQQSLQFLERAVQAEPKNAIYPYLSASSLPVIYEDDSQIDRAREHVASSIERMHHAGLRMNPRMHSPNTFFYLAYHGRNDRRLQSKIASVWEPCDRLDLRTPKKTERIRVGFLTRYLTDHTIGMLTGGLIALLDPARFETATFAFDDNHPWFRANCSEFHVAPQRPSDLIDHVAKQNLDILIFPEIGMDALTNAVARSRMAPVQCAMWGHPVTTGIPTIDYFLSSRLLESETAAEHYSEQLVLLETLPAYYFRPQPEEGLKTRAQLGLPESSSVYACPQSLFKFHPDFDPVLDAVLAQDPTAAVVLVEGGNERWTKLLKNRFQKTMRHHDRVIWLPRLTGQDFYALLNAADVVLDPMHFGGGRSNYLTMSAGTPLVTLPSEFMRGRVAAGMYQKLDYWECVAESPEDYIAKAITLGSNADYRRAVGEEIRLRSDVLFEDRGAVTALEQFLEAAKRGTVEARTTCTQ